MTTESDKPQGGLKPYANPYLAGILLGLVLLVSFVILGAGLGASGGVARIAASLSQGVSASHTLGSEYFGKWGANPLNYYLVFMFVGTFVGALFSALLANRMRIQVERGAASSASRRLWHALVGGVMVGFALYDLAWVSAAELAAAGAALDYAQRWRAERSLRERVALQFAAEVLSNLMTRLVARAADVGFSGADVDPGLDAFIARHLGSAAMENLGRKLVDRAAAPLPDDLDEEKALIRKTFRQFADEQVRPVAARIHRDDAMIPDEITEGLKSLGCFGLSIPARFGGLNPDEGDDSLGMILVTEELSRNN